MKNKKIEILILVIAIVIQTLVYIVCGINKSYIHMDEAYSLGLASYDKVEIQENEDFYNTWHNKEYYEDYLSVGEDEIGNYKGVYENQKNDVHPPLYYLLLRFAMGFSQNHFSKWCGITLNIIIFAFITIIMYKILNELLEKEEYAKEKSIILATLSSLTMASLTNVIYIRMYALATLNILIATYLHIKLYKNNTKSINLKLLTCISIFTLLGVLTHYYYIFYIAMLYLILAIKYIKNKEYKALAYYTIAMLIAGVASLIIFPYMIKHMFFGYRGQGVISNLTNISKFITSILAYITKANFYAFNNLLFIIIIGIIIYKICKKKIRSIENKEEREVFKLILAPTVFYFILVSVASPWIELRYIMPICSLLFVLVIYYLYKTLTNQKYREVIIAILLIVILKSPTIFKIEPEVMYSDKKEIVQKIENEWNLPTIFMFNSQNNRFLDDILLFSKLNESYIAKDIEPTEENIKKILEDKETSKGIIVFINEGQDNDQVIETIKKATNLEKSSYVKRLNACDVYHIEWGNKDGDFCLKISVLISS